MTTQAGLVGMEIHFASAAASVIVGKEQAEVLNQGGIAAYTQAAFCLILHQMLYAFPPATGLLLMKLSSILSP